MTDHEKDTMTTAAIAVGVVAVILLVIGFLGLVLDGDTPSVPQHKFHLEWYMF